MRGAFLYRSLGDGAARPPYRLPVALNERAVPCHDPRLMNWIEPLQEAWNRQYPSVKCRIHDAHAETELSEWLFAGASGANEPGYHLFVTSEQEPHGWRVAEELWFGAFVACLCETLGLGELVTLGELPNAGSRLSAQSEVSSDPRPAVKDQLERARKVILGSLKESLSSAGLPADETDAREVFSRLAPAGATGAVGSEHPMADSDPARKELLKELAAAYAVGRRNGADRVHGLPWLPRGGSGDSHTFLRDIASKAWTEIAPKKPVTAGPGGGEAGRYLVALNLLWLFQDIAAGLVAGAPGWACTGTPVRLLLIDDKPERIRPQLENALALIGNPHTEWELSCAEGAYWNKLLALIGDRTTTDDVGLVKNDAKAPLRIEHFDVLLVDVEFDGRAMGPEIIEVLSEYLDRRARGGQMAAVPGAPLAGAPRIIVLSLSRDTRHVQQCLNMGAEAFVSKDRVHLLPAVLAKVRRRNRRSARGGLRTFSTLWQLPPAVRAELQDTDLRGGLISGEAFEGAWIQSLPKTDLHCHIGTSINLHVIQALALNTCWYLMKSANGGKAAGELRDTVWRVVATAADVTPRSVAEAPEKFWHAANDLICLGARVPALPSKNVYDEIIGRICRCDRPIDQFEVASVFISILTIAMDELKNAVDELGLLDGVRVGGTSCPVGAELEAELGSTWRRATSSRSWHCPQTERWVRELVDDSLKLRGVRWARLRTTLTKRIKEVVAWLSESQHSKKFSHVKASDKLTFGDFVKLPEGGDHERTLLRYLQGADLLGSAFLQYPENLFLAAADLVGQAVADNVVYTELRCATPGYTRGGLGSGHATDLLTQALDVFAHRRGCTSMSGNRETKQRWVRFNVLLGAKRHKPDREFDETVHLLSQYLQRGPAELKGACNTRPLWWRRTHVAGFDLSGNEQYAAEKFRDRIEPLFALSAPVTIHAGEAASADSIWQAVYRLGAARIGHGLRLREHARLMEYCTRRGICLELCPISNEFTNDFKAPPTRDDYVGESRAAYPLRFFMERGLEVCVATDNRQLHRKSRLTDDYLEAARLSGGLTRWEVLRLVYAGFKNAFLPPSEVDDLLASMGDEIFSLLRRQDAARGRFWS